MEKKDKNKSEAAVKKVKPRAQTGTPESPETERARLAELIELNNENFHRLLDEAPDGILLLDGTTGVITEANPFIEKFMGYPRTELVGKKLWEIRTFGQICADQDAFLKLWKKKSTRQDNLILTGRDDQSCPVEFISKAYRVGKKQVFQCTFRDIRGRLKVEDAISRANRIHAVISEINQMIVRTKDRDEILSNACRITVDEGNFRMAWIGLSDEKEHAIKPVAWEGVEQGYLRRMKIISSKDSPEGRGPTGTAVRENRTVYCEDIASDPRMAPWREEALKRGYRGSIALPMTVKGKVVGAFTLYAAEPFFFDATEIRLLEEVTDNIAFALDAIESEKMRKQAEEELRGMVKRLSIIYRADEQIGTSLDVEQIYTAIHQAVKQVMPCEDFVISLYDEARNEMQGNYIVENDKRVAVKPYKADHGLGGHIVRTRQPVILNSPEQIKQSDIEFEPYGRGPITSSVLAVPLQTKAKAIGVLSVQSYHSQAYTPDDQLLLEMLAIHAAIAIENARLFDQAQTEINERRQAETALRESEEKYRALMEQSSDGIVIADERGTIIEWNRRQAEIMGYSKEEVLGKPIWEAQYQVVPPEQQTARILKQLEGLIVKILEDRETEYFGRTIEGKIRSKDGTMKNIEFVIYPIRVGKGFLIGSVIRDITDRKKAEETLKESEKRYRLLAENVSDVIWILDAQESLFRFVSPSVKRLRGYSPEEVMAQKVFAALTPGSNEYLAQILPDRIKEFQSGVSRDYVDEMEQTCKDGSTVWTETTTRIILDQETGHIDVYGVSRDISARRKVEQELKGSETRYRQLVERLPAITYVISQHPHKTLFVSPQVEQILGYTPEEWIADPGIWLRQLHPEDRERVLAEDKFSHEEDRDFKSEYRIHARDGHIVWLRDETSHLTFEPGQEPILQGIEFDITDSKQVEIERQTLMEIMQGQTLTEDLQGYLKFVHQAIGKVIFAENFYVILKNKSTGLFEEIYSVDKYDPPAPPSLLDKSISAHVFHTRKPLLLNRAGFDKLAARGKVKLVGANIASWLGVPLITSKETIGVMAVQDYEREDRYSEHDQDLMVSVAGEVAQIVERKRAEQALRESEEVFHNLFNNTEVGMIRTRLDGSETLNANEKFLEITGRKREEVIGRPSLNFWADPKEREEMVRKLNEDGRVVEFEFKLLNKKGAVRNCIASLNLIPGTGILDGSILDITERRLAEAALSESEKRHRDLFDNAGLAIFQVTAEGRPIAVNPEFVRMFGYDSAEDIFTTIKNTSELFVDPQRRAEIIRMKAENPDMITFENLYRRKDGSTFLGRLTLREVKVLDGQAMGLEGVVEDITSRRQMEQALQKSEELFRTAFQTSPDAININRLKDGMYVNINEGFTALSGYTRGDAIGKSSLELDLWNDPADRKKLVKRLQEQGVVTNLEAKFKMKDGHLVTGLMSARIIMLNNVPHILSITREIEEIKRAEDALRSISTRQEALLASIPDIIMEVNIHEVYTWANPAGFEFFGEDVIGKSAEDFIESGQEVEAVTKRLFQGDENTIYVETWQRRKDGQKRLLAWWCRSLKNEHGEVTGALSTARDITEIAQVQEKVRELNAELEKRVEERTRELRDTQEKLVRQEKLAVLGQLAGSVGHELRNPLGIINNAAYYLRLIQPQADEKVKEYLGIIEHETRTADKIITDLLDFSRIKSVDKEKVQAAELIKQSLVRFPAPESVVVTLKIPNDLPAVKVDPRQITQVLGNLVVNACQAMTSSHTSGTEAPRENRLTILAKRKGKEVAIAVKDTGVGIPPENLGKLFEPLFTTKLKGIGLGLAVSKKLVEANGGRIEVGSEPGKGSTFTVYLPREETSTPPKNSADL